MVTTKKSFCIVCVANYCRSPVAENLFKFKYGNEYEFFSAGVSPIAMSGMDPRSLKFLENINISHNLHTPKKINKRILNYFDKFLAVDFYVLNQLNILYPRYRNKFLCLTEQFSEINIIDPFKFQPQEYINTMNDIKHVVENINLDNL